MVNGGRAFTGVANTLHMVRQLLVKLQYPAHSINILVDGRDCCVAAQDTLDLRTLRFSHGFTCRKKCCADAEQPLLVDRMHAHVRLVLRARSEVDSNVSPAFTVGPYLQNRHREHALLCQKRVCTASCDS